ncbi:MAG: radical SAM protein [Candidatus Gastranaerophilales bacterium]|nr:radical SAM protein [Candidatus Gastranaerophilales bacterium]
MIYKSCDCIAHGIYFGTNSIWHCGNLVGRGVDEEALITDFKGEKIDWASIIEKKRQLREQHKNGQYSEGCKNCPQLVEKDWDEEDYINESIIAHFTKCNSNCSYCFTSSNKQFFNSFQEYPIMPLLEDLKTSGYLRFDKKVIITGGEPTEARDFDKMIDFFEENNQQQYFIETSGIRYSKSIEKILEAGKANVSISIDSGCSDTYKEIKRVDEFKKVSENIKKYNEKTSDGSFFCVKYLIVPNLNDNMQEINRWFDNCKEIGLKNLEISMETGYMQKYPQKIPEIIPQMIKAIQERGTAEGINVRLSGSAYTLLNNIENGTFVTIAGNPVKREYFSCDDFLHTICFMPEGIRHCMYLSPDNAPPVIPIFKNSVINTDYIFEYKHEIEDLKMNGIIQDDCKTCFRACKKEHDNQDYISTVLISHRKDCNADCIFCYNKFDEKTPYMTGYKILPQLEKLKPYFKNGCEMHFGGGEPTMWEEFDDIIAFALKENFNKIHIATNGTGFSEKLAEALSLGKAQVAFTTDTANELVFKNLKHLDFKLVTNNIKKYLEYDTTKEHIENKYIIIPNINDNEEDIEEWVEYNKNLGIKRLAIDIEAIFFSQNRQNISPRFKRLVIFAEKLIIENGMECNLYSFAKQMRFDEKK